MKLLNLTIKQKLIAIIMIISTVIMLLTFTVSLIWEFRDTRRSLVKDMISHARMLADNCKASIAFENKQDAEQVLSTLRLQGSTTFACIYDKHGRIFAQYQSEDVSKKIQPPLPGGQGYVFENGGLSVFQRIVLDGEEIGTIYLFNNMMQVYSELKGDVIIAAVVLLLGFVVSYFLSSSLQKMISRPILNLAYVAQKVSKNNNYSVRASKESNDEVGYLTQVFNKMLVQIQKRESELVTAKEQLEVKVKERTVDLSNTNRQLSEEITERKKAEEQQKQVAEEWKTTFNSITDMVSIHDKDFKIIRANEAFASRYNMKPSEIIGKTCCELIHGTKKPPKCCPHMQTLNTGQPSRTEFFDPNLKIHVEASTSPVFDKNGQINASVHIAKDISERKRAEEEVRNIAKFPAENPNPVVRIQKDGKILYGNDASKSLLIEWKTDIGGEMSAKWRRFVKEAFESEHTRNFEEKVGDKIFSFVVAPSKEGGYVNLYALDITERKQAEAELKVAQEKLIETARTAGMAEVAADILHNVGNVLNSINVSTTLITEKITDSELTNLEKIANLMNDHIDDLNVFLSNDPRGKHIPIYLKEVSKALISEQADIISKLRRLEDNVQHIKDIISMQQSYSKISGIMTQTSLSKLVEDAIQINNAGLERHGVQVIRQFEELPDIEIDKHKMLQILVNLISNAKYALTNNNKGEKFLTIRINKYKISRFRIEVEDNGMGITKDKLTKIFNHGFTTRKTGHGFGLHSCSLASQEMGGSLAVHSDGAGQGATFTLELPYKPVELKS